MRFSGGVIQDGKYTLPEEKGATAGKYRVEISWLKVTGKQLKDAETGEMYDERVEALPDKYHKNSELTAEVPSEDEHLRFCLEIKLNPHGTPYGFRWSAAAQSQPHFSWALH